MRLHNYSECVQYGIGRYATHSSLHSYVMPSHQLCQVVLYLQIFIDRLVCAGKPSIC